MRGRPYEGRRWSPYAGSRIRLAGHRLFVEHPATERFGPMTRCYGYVWREGEWFKAYFEVMRPGEVEDVELGRFTSQRAARGAVKSALLDPRNSPDVTDGRDSLEIDEVTSVR